MVHAEKAKEMNPNELPEYRWPDLSPVIIRRYVVQDDQGRIGIAYADPYYHKDVLFAHPVTLPSVTGAGNVAGTETLPQNSIFMTDTAFHLRDGAYQGTWCDNQTIGQIPADEIRTLTIIDDLGYIIPDKFADVALAGSDQMGHWDYGATLGKIGGKTPVKGQASNEMTVEQAEEYASDVGETVTARGIRLAAKNNYIPGARKIGRDWLIPYEGFNHYLDNRPRPGRKISPAR